MFIVRSHAYCVFFPEASPDDWRKIQRVFSIIDFGDDGASPRLFSQPAIGAASEREVGLQIVQYSEGWAQMPSLEGLLSDSDEEVAPPAPTGGVRFCVLDDPLLQETVVAVAPHSAGHRAISAAAGATNKRAAQRSKRAIKESSGGGSQASAKVKAASGGACQASAKVKAKVSKVLGVH